MSTLITLAGFTASVAVLAFPAMTFVAWSLAIVGGVTATLFFVDVLVRAFMMKKLPVVHHSLRPGDFLRAPSLSQGSSSYQFVTPRDSSEGQLYPYVDISHRTDAIRAANPDLTPESRLSLYRRWYQACPQGFLHLEKRELTYWTPIAVAIALPVTRVALEKIRSVDPNRQKKVIDLEGGDFAASLGADADCLLVDSWIVEQAYRGVGHGKTRDEGGFANSLVLRLIARFWSSKALLRNPRFLIETNNDALIDALAGLGFQQAGRSKTDERFLETDAATLRSVMPKDYVQLVRNIDVLGSVNVITGTTPR